MLLCDRIQWTQADTWFPGFAWKVCVCPKCSNHVGWMFEPFESATATQTFPSDRGFYALTVNNVLSESCKYSKIFYSVYIFCLFVYLLLIFLFISWNDGLILFILLIAPNLELFY